MPTRTLVDANVLYSRTLRDWLFQLQIESGRRIFTTCWTVDILAEVIANLRKQLPYLDGGVLTTLHDRITGSMTERIDNYSPTALTPIRDVFDRHIHAAAIAGRVDLVLTSDHDLLDLDSPLAERLPYEICHPDSFFLLIDDIDPHLVRQVTATTQAYWSRKDPQTSAPDRLAKAGCPGFALRVWSHIASLEGDGLGSPTT